MEVLSLMLLTVETSLSARLRGSITFTLPAAAADVTEATDAKLIAWSSAGVIAIRSSSLALMLLSLPSLAELSSLS